MRLFLKKKFNPKKIDSSTTHEVTRTLRNIFSQASQYDSSHLRKKLYSRPCSTRKLERLKRAHLFVSQYFHTKSSIYQIVQTDKGKNLHLSMDMNTAITSPFADAAKLIPLPVVGHVVAAGLKKGLKLNSDQKRIQRATDKSIYLLLDENMITLMALIFVTVHRNKITDQTIKESCHNLNKELEIFFSIAKKQMASHADPENLDDFWANVFSTYLQVTVQHNTPNGDFFFIDFSLKEILNNELKPLLKTLKNTCSTTHTENTKKTVFDPLGGAHPPPIDNQAVILDPPLASLNPQPGPETTFTLNPTLSSPCPSLTNPPPNALIMNLIIPENQAGHPITIRVPRMNQPLLINVLPDTPLPSTVYATQDTQTHSVVLSSPSLPNTASPCNPLPTHLTTTGHTEVKPLPIPQTVSSEKELTPISPPPPIPTSARVATTAMKKMETPRGGPTYPPVTLNQSQACIELTAFFASLLLTSQAQELYRKSQNMGSSQSVQQTPQSPQSILKPSGPSFFSCGISTAQQINNKPPCAYLSPVAA